MMEHNTAYKAKTRRRGRGSLLITVRMHMTLLTFTILLLFGILIGSSAPGFLDLKSYDGMSQVLQHFLLRRHSQSMAATFASALIPNAIFWAILLLCGFCAVSTPLIITVLIFKGMGYGLFASVLISQYGAAALQYLAISVLPNLLISGITLLFCCRDAHRMSKSIWQMMQPQVRGNGEGSTAGEFGARMILYGVFLCLGAAIEAYLCALSISSLLL